MNGLLGINHESACAGKQRLNQRQAARAAVRMGQQFKEPFTIYKCVVCAAWHLGHHLGWKKKKGLK